MKTKSWLYSHVACLVFSRKWCEFFFKHVKIPWSWAPCNISYEFNGYLYKPVHSYSHKIIYYLWKLSILQSTHTSFIKLVKWPWVLSWSQSNKMPSQKCDGVWHVIIKKPEKIGRKYFLKWQSCWGFPKEVFDFFSEGRNTHRQFPTVAEKLLWQLFVW